MLGLAATSGRVAMYILRRRPGMVWAAVGWLLLAGTVAAGRQDASTDALWDPQRYIKIDEIKPGMEAYCLTDYGEAGIEKFGLKVVNIVRDFEPAHNIILVVGVDERFKHTGIVAGCSGSPVYIDGRLAGALAMGFPFAKDPLYGVTPIEEMLQVSPSSASPSAPASRHAAFRFDFSKPINLAEIDRQIAGMQPLSGRSAGGATALPCPMLISGLPTEACQRLAPQLEAMGFVAVPGLSGAAQSGKDPMATFKPGGTLTIPLVAGDIKMSSLGTVTEIRGNRVYGFGHSFLGDGATNLPLAGGEVYTVVSSIQRSFKLGAASDIIGAITVDGSTAIYGEIGAKPKMVPLTVRIEPCEGTPHTYNCQVAYNQLLTPALVRASVIGAAMPLGSSFPADHTVAYNAAIQLTDGRSIHFANTSTGMDVSEPTAEIAGALALLMNNPYGCPDVKSVDCTVRVAPKNIAAYLWSVSVADPKVKAGEDLDIEFVVESYLKEKRRHQVKLTVPKSVAPGKYNLMLLGIYEYENFLRKSMPYRFVATNQKTLVDALNDALNIDRTKLYCLLVLPPSGIALDRAELPSFPETKSMILQSDKRTLAAQPYPHWVEKVVETGTVIADKEIVPITIEQ